MDEHADIENFQSFTALKKEVSNTPNIVKFLTAKSETIKSETSSASTVFEIQDEIKLEKVIGSSSKSKN